jgi:hypothetical protein
MLNMFSCVLTLLVSASPQTPTPAGRLTSTAPDGWKIRPATSSMRVAEFILPRADGDTEDGDVVVYYFGASQGGDVEANITRWVGQMTQPDGRASKDLARRGAQTINGLAVTTLEITGTYIAEMRPGATEHFNKPGFRMRTAVVKTPRGPYFVKMLGPDKTITKWGPSFAEFLRTMRFEP